MSSPQMQQSWFQAQIMAWKHNAIETIPPEDLLRVISEQKQLRKESSKYKGEKISPFNRMGPFQGNINKGNPHYKQEQSKWQNKVTLKVLSEIIRKHQDKWLFQTEIIQLCSPSQMKTPAYYTQSVSLRSVHFILIISSTSLGYANQLAKYIFYWSLYGSNFS